MGFGWSLEQIGKIDGWDSEFDSLTVEGPCQKPYPSFDLGIIQIYMCFSKTITLTQFISLSLFARL